MAGTVEELLRGVERTHSLTRQAWWIRVAPTGAVLPPHGWKLHVSSRSATYLDLLSRLLPALLDVRCVFKLAHSPEAVTELNDGISSPSAVGKAVTIYPDQERVRELGLRLAALLRDDIGPRILSDRRVDHSAPVYYRYGPFVRSGDIDGFGRSLQTLYGPNGEEFDGAATTGYRVPSWATDPFEGGAAHASTLLGDRYRATACVYKSARGDIYRAVDEETGWQVVVKQARAHVAESAEQADTRIRLRNERRILELAHDVPGVPRFVDHFRHADDEYLVSEDLGPTNLSDDVIDHGPYLPNGERSLARLATNIARVVAALHGKGVLVRDLKPSNVVVDNATGEVHLIDFGSATYGGLVLSGHTLPYSPPRQVRGEAPTEADDLYALGMTLIEAVTGMRPVSSDDDLDLSRQRSLETVRARFGDQPTGILAIVVDLLSDDPAVARTAFDQLVAGTVAPSRVVLAGMPDVSPDSLDALIASVRSELLAEVDALLDRPPERETAATAADPSVLAGTAGIGLEILEHFDVAGVPERVSRLVATTARTAARDGMPSGLFIGHTGAEVFLRRADAVESLPKRDVQPTGIDLFENGAAGVGLAHLWRAATDGDPGDLRIADECANRIADARPDDPGFAHGRAGLTLFRVALVEHGRLDPSAIESDLTQLAEDASRRIAEAAPGIGNPLRHVSWCNGLAGTARTLLYAARVLDRPDLSKLALSAGDVCVQWVPRLAALGQCCGAAGIGDVLVDLARVEGGERHADNAFEVVRQIRLRSGGTHDRPLVGATLPRIGRASWGNGLAGILGFLRRLRDGGSRIFPEV